MYTRSESPLTSIPTTSYQLTSMGSSLRPSSSYTPPMYTGISGGLFQKRHGQCVPHGTAVRGINRVQSMPAHNSQHHVGDVSFSAFLIMSKWKNRLIFNKFSTNYA